MQSNKSPALPGASDTTTPQSHSDKLRSKSSLIPKKPPPERTEAIRTRNWVIVSFWLVVIFAGLPVWLWTTSIHRAVLPLDEMLEWADGKACKYTFPLRVVLEAPGLQEHEAQHVVYTTQRALDDLNESPAHHLRLELASSATGKQTGGGGADIEVTGPEEPALSVQLQRTEQAPTVHAELRPHSTVLDVFYASSHVPSTSSSSSELTKGLASRLHELFAEEKASISAIMTSSEEQIANGPQALSPELSSKLARRATRALKYSPLYHITVSLITATGAPTSWDIDAALAKHLEPLFDSYSISNFSVDTQVQLYSTFAPSARQPQHDPDTNTWTLRTEDLSSFVNAAEWPLGPGIGDGPTLHFILYVPDPAQSLLRIHETGATSWLIPQWGGVAILNPPLGSDPSTPPPAHLSKEALDPALLTFAHQILALLGASDAQPSIPLQLQSLTRQHAAATLRAAAGTLGSLARLARQLASIPIPEHVAAGVAAARADLRAGCAELGAARFAAALARARAADRAARRAFFDPSMVGQVYFPDEHKIAVYLPLLGPIGVPLVTSALRELARWRRARRGVPGAGAS